MGEVFVSHTSDMMSFPGTRSYAQAAVDAVLRAGHRPIDMAYFAARDGKPSDYCKQRVQASDIFLGVIGFRYGSLVPDSAGPLSYVDLEFRVATVAGIPRLVFILDEDTPVPTRLVDRNRDQIDAFRGRLLEAGVIVQTFSNADALEAGVLHALSDLRSSRSTYAPSQTGQRPWMVPVATGRVVDRPELTEKLIASLLANEHAAVGITTALDGAGGFGKTTLAAIVCRRLEIMDHFPGGLLWATVGAQRTGADLAALVNGLSEVLSGEQSRSSDPMVAGARLGELLDARPPVLLVIDDVWEADQLAPFLVGGLRCRRLITTRNSGLVPLSSVSVFVDAMKDEQAAELLTGDTDALPRYAVVRLITLTGRWPVLLSLVSRAIAEHVRNGARPADAATWLIGRLESSGPVALDLDDVSSRQHAIAATVEASLGLLNDLERNRYTDLAIFAEDVDIPFSVLRLLWSKADEPTAIEVERFCSKISRLNLTIGRWGSSEPAIRLHDVIRSYLRRLVSDERRAKANSVLLEACRSQLGDGEVPGDAHWWELPAEFEYLWRYLPYHLLEARRLDDLEKLISDLRWAEKKTAHFGSTVLVEADLTLVDTAKMRLLKEAIKANAHILTPIDPPSGLGATLASRLEAAAGLEDIVAAYREHLTVPRLENLWPLPDLKENQAEDLASHNGGVYACDFSPDGSLLAVASGDGALRLWTLAEETTSFVKAGYTGGVRTCRFSPNSRLIAFSGGDGVVRLWDIDSDRIASLPQERDGGVWCCAFSPDGSLLAAAGANGKIQIWDTSSSSPVATLDGHIGGIYGCAFSPDSNLLASAGTDGKMIIWDLAGPDVFATLVGHTGGLWDCAFSPDGSLIASAGGDTTVRIWRTHSLELSAVLEGHIGGVDGCAFSPDSRLLATASDDKTVRIWNVSTGATIAVLEGHVGFARKCVFSPDGQLLASASADGTARIWEVDSGRIKRILGGSLSRVERSCIFMRHGQALAFGNDQGAVQVFDVSSHEVAIRLDGGLKGARGCAISPSEERLAAGYADGTVRVWNVLSGESIDLEGHAGGAWGCAFSPDGRYVASSGTDRRIIISDLFDSSTIAALAGHPGGTWECSFSADGRFLAAAGHDGSLQLWDMIELKPFKVFRGHTDWVSSCVFSPDGSILASSSGDRSVRLWDSRSGAQLAVFRGHTDWVWKCAFSADGKFLASASTDWTLRVWDVSRRTCTATIRVAQPLYSCAWHPRDHTLAAAGGGGMYLFSYVSEGETAA